MVKGQIRQTPDLANCETLTLHTKMQMIEELCPSLGPEVTELLKYLLKEYVKESAVTPNTLALMLEKALRDIERGYKVNRKNEQREFVPKYFFENKMSVLKNASTIVQLIDAVAQPEFAEEFRRIAKRKFNYAPPRIYEIYALKKGITNDYLTGVERAVDYWKGVIYPGYFQYREDQNQCFSTAFTNGILEALETHGKCTVWWNGRGGDMSQELSDAIKAAEIHWFNSYFPNNAYTKKRVVLYEPYGGGFWHRKILWKEK